MKHIIVISGRLHETAVQQLVQNKAFEIIYKPDCSPSDLKKLVVDASVLITRSETTVDQELMTCAPKLKVIARAAVGVANIDIEYATQKGILVMNTPGKNTNSAAEHTMALLLSMLRKVPQAYQSLKQGLWNRHLFSGQELRDKSIGILGLGNVGHRVAKFAKGFDMKVYAYDPYISPKLFVKYGVISCKSLKELVSQVQILSLHVPLNKQTRGMVNKELLMALPKGSFLLNAARGGLVCEQSLLEIIEHGHLAGAALDTWDNEPKPNSKLVSHPQVWCSPHIGASTLEAQKEIGYSIVEQVCRALNGGIVSYPVNLPKIGVFEGSVIKPYSILAEKLGSLTAQLLTFNPATIEIFYRGDLVRFDQRLIRLGFMKGYTSQVSNEFISHVNASTHFDRLGVVLNESQDEHFHSYKSAIKVVLSDALGHCLQLGGVVFDQQHLKLSFINGYSFEVDPKGAFVIIENEDRPGVIGLIGQFFAKNNVNIESFDLSRKKAGEKAMAVIKIDSMIESDKLNVLADHSDICSVKRVEL